MQLTYSREKITALMGTKEPLGYYETVVAMHVIDGILDNDGVNGVGFADWTAKLGVQIYATEDFLEREEIDGDEIDWDEVHAAVGEAICMLQLPKGIVLVNADAHAVFACGRDLDSAKDELAKDVGIDLAFTAVGFTGFRTTAADGRYIVVAAPMPAGGWEADNADFVLAVGDVEGYLLAHAIVREAA